jgi:hypothetical protein
MIKALLLIFDPVATWEGILLARRSMVSILVRYLLPMILITSAWEAYGLIHWGKWQGEVAHIQKFSVREAAIVETAQVLLALVVIFVGAKLVKAIGETFRGRHTYPQAFTAVAYGLSPLFLLHLLDAFPGVSPWVSWSIGIILSVSVLYQGLPRMMEPDPSHAFGLFVMSGLLLALVTALVRYVTALCLTGRFPHVQAIISDLANRLLF